MSRAAGRGESGHAVGVVIGISPSGLLTARASGSSMVPEGSDLRTDVGGVRGRVVRVFGPVARPYYSIRLARPLPLPEAARIVGASVVRG
ncbi:MAG: hypothetical protein L3K13_06095 [Thermoplasmata archaeon]|nr:hypothetical protein [Thermoplasmata archaeon]